MNLRISRTFQFVGDLEPFQISFVRARTASLPASSRPKVVLALATLPVPTFHAEFDTTLPRSTRFGRSGWYAEIRRRAMADAALFKKLYRILTWVTFAGLILTIALVLKKSAAPDVPYDKNAAVRAAQKFQAADEAKASGQPAQVQLDRTELNSYLADNLQLAGQPTSASASPSAAPTSPNPVGGPSSQPEAEPTLEEVQSSVKDVRVDMDGDVVKAYVIFDFHGKDMSLELDGHLSAENGYMKFVPIAGKLGSLPLPQSTLDSAVEKLMASPENREKLRLPADISDIQIVNGQAVLTYK
jgi:hypothetical protein